MDTVRVRGVLCKNFKIFDLFDFNHLTERIADLVIFACDYLILIQSFNSSPFLFEEHIHLANTID